MALSNGRGKIYILMMASFFTWLFGVETGAVIWAVIGAVGIFVTLGYLIYQDIASKKKEHRRKTALASPFDVTYLIPKRHYAEVLFEGAAETEYTPTSLTVGVGTYRLMHLVRPKLEVDVGPIVLRFEGPEQNRPVSRGRDNPFIVERFSSGGLQIPDQVRDWNGDVHIAVSDWPRHYIPGEPTTFGNLIQTSGVWNGTTILTFPVYGGERVKVAMPFRVSVVPADDEIPFLKGEHHGETKERAARKAADEQGL